MALTEPIPAPPPISTSSPPLAGLTPEEFMRLCGDEENLELVRGEVIQLAPAGRRHGKVGMRVGRILDEFVEAHHLGDVYAAETGFILESNPYTVRGPDVSFVASARFIAEEPEKFHPGPPDLAVEILSPTDSLKAAEAKARMYLRAGGSVVWILNPADSTVRVYRPGEEPQQYGPEEEISGEPLLPGFRCPVAKLFGG